MIGIDWDCQWRDGDWWLTWGPTYDADGNEIFGPWIETWIEFDEHGFPDAFPVEIPYEISEALAVNEAERRFEQRQGNW